MSIDPRELSAEERAEFGIDENGRPLDGTPLAEREAAARAAAEQDLAEVERLDRERAAAGPAPVTDEDLDRVLVAHGYVALRAGILSIAQQALTVDVQSIDAVIRRVTMDLPRLRAEGIPLEHIDGLNGELELMRAVKTFRLELKRIAEKRAARERLTEGIIR